MENRLALDGTLAGSPDVRYTPAGIPIARFSLHHESTQEEAGMQRRATCTAEVVVTGEELIRVLHRMGEGSRIRIIGFLSRAGSRSERLVVHANRIEPLPETAN